MKGSLAKINTNRTNLHVDDPPEVTCQHDLLQLGEDQAADHLINGV
jgi:hypothetical protein